MRDVRVESECPTCRRPILTEVAEDRMRLQWGVRMRHGDFGATVAVSHEAVGSTGGSVLEVVVHSLVTRVCKETCCLDWRADPPVPLSELPLYDPAPFAAFPSRWVTGLEPA